MDQIYLQTKAAIEELVQKAGVKKGNIVVVGCSIWPSSAASI